MDAAAQAVERNQGWELAAGPNVEGVVLLQQSAWPQDVIDIFHANDFIDAASIRMPWRELEPSDEKFDWTAMDAVLDEVKKWNQTHPERTPRTMHIRVMAGVFSPEWMEKSGVKFYETHHLLGPTKKKTSLHIPMAYDNPEFIKQLREVYRAMYERYKDEPLVTVYHGTWSAGPWDEIFHPMGDQPYPKDYSKQKFVAGMVEQLDILIEEFALKSKVCELPYSGKYPSKDFIDITGPLTQRAVERLGKRSPFLFIQSNGWGESREGVPMPTMGHLEDLMEAYGEVNLTFQAVGTNAGAGWWPQGNFERLNDPLKRYEATYVELYPPDFAPELNEKFGLEKGMKAFQAYLKERNRTLYVRDGQFTQSFNSSSPQKVGSIWFAHVSPEQTSIKYEARMEGENGQWSEWIEASRCFELPAGTTLEVRATLHTDDGYVTPRVAQIEPYWQTQEQEAATRNVMSASSTQSAQ